MYKKSFFIVVEGIDGAGKSTIARRIVQVLQKSLGNNVKLTFEPNDPSSSGLFIRQALMKKIKDVPLHTLALAFAVNRSDHCNREIEPFLTKGNGGQRVVCCDRYYLSSLVYQSDDNFSYDDVMRLNSGALTPDLTIFMNASDRVCYERMRHRNQDRELFEKNLKQVREKYLEAIEYLRARGDTIEIVNADGNISEVLEKVLHIIENNGPDWLSISYPLPMDIEPHVFEKTEITVDRCALELSEYWSRGPLFSEQQLSELLGDMMTGASKIASHITANDVATLFLQSVGEIGYVIQDQLPWTDLDAYEMQYIMPFGMTQRGAALILGDTQRYDAIMQKVLGEKIETLEKMSDFLFILDSNPSHLIKQYYERDVVKYQQNMSYLSPIIRVIGRQHIASIIMLKGIRYFEEEYFNTLLSNNKLKDSLNHYVASVEQSLSTEQ